MTCETCAAACCRLEVWCLTDTGVPGHLTVVDPFGRTLMDRLDDGWCAALDRNTLRCRIYAQRPLVCRELEVGSPECLAERS
nr:YkgJ family cysteine cluster protein [Thiocapsa sp. KS1]